MRNFYGFFLTLALVLSACRAELSDLNSQPQGSANGISVNVTAPDFISRDGNSKSTIGTDASFAWTDGDRIGIFSHQVGSATQTSSLLALTLSAGKGTSAAYSSTTGWTLVPGNAFKYFSYYPYSEIDTREQITIDYTGQTQTANNSTEGLGAYDYMYSDMATAVSSSSASFSFHHIGCLVNVNIIVPTGYENTNFYQVRLYADTEEFSSTATYSVNDIVTSDAPTLNKQTCARISLSFGDEGIKPTEGVISAWLMMAPAQWSGKTITAKLYAAKNNVPTLSGTFAPDANQTAGAKYTYNVTSATTSQYLPDKPAAGEQLHILLFGHSFGEDCMLYLPAITKSAGITDVHYGRWFQGNCSLASHWDHVTAKDTYLYYNSDSANNIWSSSYRMVDDVLSQYPWDIILFQQSIGFGGEGDYSSYQPHLNYLTHYVDSVCTKLHGKTPVIGWNMFWGYNNDKSTAYDIGGTTGALAMYQAIVTATQAMTVDGTKATTIPLIVPTGTALQNARNTSLNDPGSAESPSTTQLLTRDGNHASFGIGRYTAACTWFQYLIAPIYEKTITGNTFRPTVDMPTYPFLASFPKDTVTDARAAICWKCAIEAVKHPYEVTTINENE